MHGSERGFVGMLIRCAGVFRDAGKLFLRPFLKGEMHGGSGRIEVRRNRLRVPAFGVKADNGSSALNGIFNLGKPLEPTRARGLGATGENQFDGLGTGSGGSAGSRLAMPA